jgi:hypothetical protein
MLTRSNCLFHYLASVDVRGDATYVWSLGSDDILPCLQYCDVFDFLEFCPLYPSPETSHFPIVIIDIKLEE